MGLFLVFCLLLIHESSSLRNVHLIFPNAVEEGGNATLFCQYDLQGEPLYSMKWYRGSHEFYRYLPKDNPRIRTFSIPGLLVDLRASNSNRVTLQHVPRYLGGNFTCEITVDEPTYKTRLETQYLEVVPKEERKENNRVFGEREEEPEIKPDNLIECEPENGASEAGNAGLAMLLSAATLLLVGSLQT